ncbi:hypothetical protein ACWCPY_43165, partial [Streptomyces sp. NPDC002403]
MGVSVAEVWEREDRERRAVFVRDPGESAGVVDARVEAWVPVQEALLVEAAARGYLEEHGGRQDGPAGGMTVAERARAAVREAVVAVAAAKQAFRTAHRMDPDDIIHRLHALREASLRTRPRLPGGMPPRRPGPDPRQQPPAQTAPAAPAGPDRPAQTTPLPATETTVPASPTPLPAAGATVPGTASQDIFTALHRARPATAQDNSTDQPPAPRTGNNPPDHNHSGHNQDHGRGRDRGRGRVVDTGPGLAPLVLPGTDGQSHWTDVMTDLFGPDPQEEETADHPTHPQQQPPADPTPHPTPPAGTMDPPADPHTPAPADQADPTQTPHPTPPPPLTIEDLARTIRELAGERAGVHLETVATHLGRAQDEIGDVLKDAGINARPLEIRFGGERRKRLGVRVDDLGGHGLAHLPPIEDLARTVRQLAAQHGRGNGVHLEALATHLRGQQEFKHLDLQRYEIKSALQAVGVTVRQFTGLVGDERRSRLGVRVDDLGGHGLAHLPPIEDLARTICQLAEERVGVHLDTLAAHLHLREDEVRGVLEAASVSVNTLELWFGGERRQRLGVRVDALGGRGLVGGGSGGLSRDASGGAGVGEIVGPVGSGGARHRVSLRPVVGGVAGSSRDRVAVNGRGGVRPADPADPAVSAVPWAGAVEHGRWGEGVSGAGEYGVGPGA